MTRALVRTTLSRYAEVDPAAWRFERNRYGRPHLLAGQCDRDLRFNLSHTRGLIASVPRLDETREELPVLDRGAWETV